MTVLYRCPVCRKKFKWLVAEEPVPEDCPICGEFIGSNRPDDDIVAPYIHLKSGPLAAADKVYREMEQASERRVEAASALVGCSKEEMSALRITNLNDRRDAPIGAVQLPQNDVSAFMQVRNMGGFGNMDGLGYSGAVSSGPFPNAGARVQQAIRQDHANRFQGTVVSDQPALEVMNPNYRRRV